LSYLFDDASTEYLEVDSAPTTAVPFSMSCWFNSDLAGTAQSMMFLGDSGSGANYFSLIVNNDRVRAGTRSPAANTSAASANTYSTNTWHHAGGVWTSGTSRDAFLDGGGKGSDTTSSTPTGVNRTSLGRLGDSSAGTYFSGLIAETAIWNAVLTDEEMAILGAGYSPLFVQPQSLIFYAPIIRDLFDKVGGLTLSLGGSPSVDNHPPIIYPSALLLPQPPTVAVGVLSPYYYYDLLSV